MQTLISADLQRVLAEQARSLGYRSPDEYLKELLGLAGGAGALLTDEEFDRILDELPADDLVSLPADFSRSDIYADHD